MPFGVTHQYNLTPPLPPHLVTGHHGTLPGGVNTKRSRALTGLQIIQVETFEVL